MVSVIAAEQTKPHPYFHRKEASREAQPSRKAPSLMLSQVVVKDDNRKKEVAWSPVGWWCTARGHSTPASAMRIPSWPLLNTILNLLFTSDFCVSLSFFFLFHYRRVYYSLLLSFVYVSVRYFVSLVLRSPDQEKPHVDLTWKLTCITQRSWLWALIGQKFWMSPVKRGWV